jgi:hypothetical protein
MKGYGLELGWKLQTFSYTTFQALVIPCTLQVYIHLLEEALLKD